MRYLMSFFVMVLLICLVGCGSRGSLVQDLAAAKAAAAAEAAAFAAAKS